MMRPSASTAANTVATAAAWPSAIGTSDRSTIFRLWRLRPSATANSQPMAGLTPWNSPSPMSASHGHSSAGTVIGTYRLRIAVRIRRTVPAFQPHLVRQLALGPGDEEFFVERDAAARL